MKKLLLLTALGFTVVLAGCHKIDDSQPPLTPQAKAVESTPAVATATPAPVAQAVPASATTTAQASQVGIFGNSFNQLIQAVKLDTKNGAIPPTPDDAVILKSINSLSDEEKLNLFKVIYIRAADNQAKSSPALNPDSFNTTPKNVVPETPGDKVLGALSGQ